MKSPRETVRSCGRADCSEPQVSRRPYCRAHWREYHRAYQREHRPVHSDLPEEQRKRANARAYARVYQRRGLLTAPALCEGCSVRPPIHKHHSDYDRPLLVTWLCGECHYAETFGMAWSEPLAAYGVAS